MTLAGTLQVTAERLRRAIAQGAYARAGAVLPEYSRQVEQTLRVLPAGGGESHELEREARELLEWARQFVLASRAAAATRRRRLPRRLAAYRSAPVRPRHTWELRG